MDHVEALVSLAGQGVRHLITKCIAVLKSFIDAMSDTPSTSRDQKVDPRLTTAGVGTETNLQEMVKQAQELRKTMSNKTVTHDGSVKYKTASGTHIPAELVTKVDSILAIVQNLQSNQREIYNYVRAMAPKYSITQTQGPVEHLECINQTHSDVENSYLMKLRESLKKTKP